ncbi:MAG: DNA repair protein RadC [bacterium]
MKIKDLPKHMRPREKLISKGVANLTDAELLAILIRTGRKGFSSMDIAKTLLQKYPKKQLLNLTYEDYLKIMGIDSSKACTILSAIELSKRIFIKPDPIIPIIENTEDVLALLIGMSEYRKEHLIALYLNARNQVIHKEIVSVGTINMSVIHPREVFEPAVSKLAVQIILAHNHPTGDVTPSDTDIETTNQLIQAGTILGIDIIDHIIVGENKYYSFKEQDLI